MERDFRRLEDVTLNPARRPFQTAELLLESLEAVLYLKDLFDGEYNAGKFQEIITYGFSNIKACIAENAPEPHHVRGVFPGKVHKFHVCLL